MGSLFVRVSTDNLIRGYVDTIPVLPPEVDSGAKTSNYYWGKHGFTYASLFNNDRFERKIGEVTEVESERNQLQFLANAVNMKIQEKFDAKNKPQ